MTRSEPRHQNLSVSSFRNHFDSSLWKLTEIILTGWTTRNNQSLVIWYTAKRKTIWGALALFQAHDLEWWLVLFLWNLKVCLKGHIFSQPLICKLSNKLDLCLKTMYFFLPLSPKAYSHKCLLTISPIQKNVFALKTKEENEPFQTHCLLS